MSNQAALRVLSEPENKAHHQVNLVPAIKAYAVERMEQLRRRHLFPEIPQSQIETDARISELHTIVTLCDSLEHQGRVFSGMLDNVFGGAA